MRTAQRAVVANKLDLFIDDIILTAYILTSSQLTVFTILSTSEILQNGLIKSAA